MFAFSVHHYVQWLGADDVSNITDLVIVDGGSGHQVFATTGFDGALTAWELSGATLTFDAAYSYDQSLVLGHSPNLAVIDIGGVPHVVIGGGVTDDGLIFAANGDLVSGLSTYQAPFSADLNQIISLTLGNGDTAIIGGLARDGGLGQITFDAATGAQTATRYVPDYADTFADPVTAIAALTVEGQTFVLTTGQEAEGVTAWGVQSNGFMFNADGVDASDGLWVSAPSVMETVSAYGQGYAILGAAGSGSLSVISVGGDGELRVTDHVLDDRDHRFAGVTDIAVQVVNDVPFIVAGGADDGLTLFCLLPTGRLLALATIEDTTDIGLANISSVSMMLDGTDLVIVAASGSETGLTSLTVDLSDFGGVFEGGSQISGTAFDDILIDSAGATTLSGGAGSDVFVMAWDSDADEIHDFDPTQDRLDLSGWVFLRALSQLQITETADGCVISYGDKVLVLRSASGAPISAASLTQSQLIGLLHYGPTATAGPGSDPVGGNPLPQAYDPAADNSLTGTFGNDSVDLGAGDDWIALSGGNDTAHGSSGNDTVFGGAGSDTVQGGGGNDWLSGDGGADVISGGDGNDTIDGGHDADRLWGGDGADTLFGGDGADSLFGDIGNDVIYGGDGDDGLRGGDDHDLIEAQGGNDHVNGGAGHDTIHGGYGHDYIAGADGDDWISGDDGDDELRGRTGNDTLYGGAGHDHMAGGVGDDTLYGGAGDDRLAGKSGDDTLIGGAGDDRLFGGAGADVFVFDGGHDVVRDFEVGVDLVRLDGSALDLSYSAYQTALAGAEVRNGNLIVALPDDHEIRINDFDDLGRLSDVFDYVW